MSITRPPSPANPPPTVRFLNLLESFITQGKTLAKKENPLPFYKDGLETIREDLAKLKGEIAALSPLILSFEQNREPATVSNKVYERFDRASRELSSAQEKNKHLYIEHEQKLAALRLEEQRINERMVNARLGEVKDAAKEIAKYNAELQALNAKVRELETQNDALELKIDMECCKCFPGSDSRNKLKAATDKLKSIRTQITAITTQLTAIQKDDNVPDLGEQLAATQSEIANLIRNFPDKITESQAALAAATTSLERVNLEVEEHYQRELAKISAQVLIAIVKISIKFGASYKLIEEVYRVQSRGAKNPLQQRMENLYQITIETKKELDKIIDCLWSPELQDKNGSLLFKEYMAANTAPPAVDKSMRH